MYVCMCIYTYRHTYVQVLRGVYQQLQQEVPRDLIARQMWCASVSAGELWAKTAAHARSMAVASMLGYLACIYLNIYIYIYLSIYLSIYMCIS